MDFNLEIVDQTKDYPEGVDELWNKAVEIGVIHKKIAYGVWMNGSYYICIPEDDLRTFGKHELKLKGLSKFAVVKKISWESEGDEVIPIYEKIDLSKMAVVVEEYTEGPYTIIWIKYKPLK